MSEEGGRRLILGSFLLVIAIITWQEIKNSRVPRPQRFVAAGVLYGLLGLLAPIITPGLAGIFGVGLLVALSYNTFSGAGATAGAGVSGAIQSSQGGIGNIAGTASSNVTQ